jgi:hypothetical protein
MIAAICILCLFNTSLLLSDDAKDSIQINTPEKAAEFASKLANGKCQKSFGRSPFSPDSYSAQLIGSRWHWGKIEPFGIRGYSAEVEFNKDGSEPNVRIVLHTDKFFNPVMENIESEWEIINQEETHVDGEE